VRRYVPPKIPAGSQLRYFNLLTPDEQARSVRRLLTNHSVEAVKQLTGLTLERIGEIQAERVYWRDEPR
jgi:hypothetical protein